MILLTATSPRCRRRQHIALTQLQRDAFKGEEIVDHGTTRKVVLDLESIVYCLLNKMSFWPKDCLVNSLFDVLVCNSAIQLYACSFRRLDCKLDKTTTQLEFSVSQL
ncbi:uncharacterized protein LOC126249609 [Schistocerca nitens]|uniref:uncharacterized protein LOC126249609 n=1 Tax=Schistocerca nitens TaxID=7011 RepID=UPI0021195AB6|nr:uncharacterized protein LOC126249609 [Schistocerca nitens]